MAAIAICLYDLIQAQPYWFYAKASCFAGLQKLPSLMN